MMKRNIIFLALALTSAISLFGRQVIDLKQWEFALGEQKPETGWKKVTIPHDWAISGEFDRAIDLQLVTVVQNGETEATYKTGRSGGLPWIGHGWYRTTLHIDGIDPSATRGKCYTLLFDGAMSNATVFLDGKQVKQWHYGYNSWFVDLTKYLSNGEHELAVSLVNEPQSSRWYPGAGLYRNVHLIVTEKEHIPVWGVTVTTPFVSDSLALVNVKTAVANVKGKKVEVQSEVLALDAGKPIDQQEHRVVAKASARFDYLEDDVPAELALMVSNPKLWSPETPNRYLLSTRVYCDGRLVDSQLTPFGIRKVEFVPTVGFLLNGKVRKFKGVCLHHDFGPLGTAVYSDAIRHQLSLLRDMGCDAIRTTHNMPAPELVELCDEMGFMLVVESFDVWNLPKGENDYHKYFSERETPESATWAERDVVNMVRHYRNNPSVVMWSVGNEVWNQTKPDGFRYLRFLQEICHREDPTRPVTCGMDQVLSVLDNNFGASVDIPGLNYRTMRYPEAYEKLPQKLILGSETASTVSSRGVYKFPVVLAPDMKYADNQSSGYDVEYCAWSGLPDQDFALQDDYPWTIGQFVWTGFDYLGEPSPYDTDAWPSHSSYFGIIDLASLPKDRYWLYRSQWNTTSPTLHALPHWTWKGREGEVTPIVVYTSYPEAEVFINGVSQGRRSFATRSNCHEAPTVQVGQFEVPVWGSKPQPELLARYRLMWLDTKYQKGEMKVVAYAHKGDKQPVDSLIYLTAGNAKKLKIELANADCIEHSEQSLYYFTISAEDAKSVPVPTADQLVKFSVKGNARILGVANGDAASLDRLQPKPDKSGKVGTSAQMHLFAGKCTVVVQAEGDFTLTASAAGMKKAQYSNL